ncbi:hypothetical protein BASA50_006466 [Batrachochytrium salamandrivorans]|uniref:Uncharacterized protein n=1 Tax=Batrachochytrium salamandrivorans TaxID=1357716 RepID=A0ABQ8FCG1_9FUNG|nr:hypothetical protein BASA50_006466 [Batrachochytrium salamandrivorans]
MRAYLSHFHKSRDLLQHYAYVASIIQYEHQPSSKLSPSSRIPISPRMMEAKHQIDLRNNQSSAFKQTFPIHGSVGSVLIEDEESGCIDISHEISTGMDAIAAVVLSGGVGGFCLNSYTWVDDVIPPGMVADTECVGDNPDPIGICTDIDHRNNTMMDTGVILSDGIARVYSNSTMQLDSTNFPEIVVGVGCVGGNADTNGGQADTQCGNTTMTAAGVILSCGSVRVYSNSPTRLDSSRLPDIAVEAECVGKRIVTSRVRICKPCGGRIMTTAAAVLVDGEAKICSNRPTREHYIKQFDISRVGDTICKACKDVQAYDGGHLLDTLTSAVDYVERHQGNSMSRTRPIWVQR